MDKRRPLLNLLNKYKPTDPGEIDDLGKMLEFVRSHEGCFENDFKIGHVTGSAFVVDENLEYTLLTHHSVLDKWFQFGGHSDGHSNVLETALREAREESGLKNLRFYPKIDGIFDIDIHPIPAKGDIPLHDHYDVRFLLIADMNEKFTVSNESKDLKWIKLEDVKQYNPLEGMQRMVGKVISLR